MSQLSQDIVSGFFPGLNVAWVLAVLLNPLIEEPPMRLAQGHAGSLVGDLIPKVLQ
ncbi:MAG TPA: hypothetical protein VJH03_02260 [Blastocatellia bacterium]|nr:hypothetical protein [Blastocatellia bacterium]